MDSVGVAVIGAGVVGLAVAERLSRSSGDLVVVERQDSFGRETSSRNSEVIHAGLYYGSQLWKTRLCVRGNPLLYELCAREGIACRRTGKIVAASGPEELPVLEDLAAQARANGVQGVRLLGAREVAALEPRVRAAGRAVQPGQRDRGFPRADGLAGAPGPIAGRGVRLRLHGARPGAGRRRLRAGNPGRGRAEAGAGGRDGW